MPRLEDALRAMARKFADDLVAALHRAPVEDLVEATKPGASRREGSKIATPRATTGRTTVGGVIDRAIAETARSHRLNERETTILAMAVRGATRTAIGDALGSNENTLKTQTRVLLKKLGVPFLSDAAIAVLHRALGSTAVELPLRPA